MKKTQDHEWHESIPREEGGGKRYTRAKWDTRRWHFYLLEPSFEDWQPLPDPGVTEFEALREVLWRKYQRKRLPFRFIENVDAILEDLRQRAGDLADEEPSEQP